MNNRIEQLDSIRGLASVTVVIGHIYYVFAFYWFSLISNTFSPLKVLINGHSAVILFFVLSGFVLSFSLLKGKVIPYRQFLIKRIFRIYFPYLIAIFTSIVLSFLISKGGITELSDWFNRSWNEPITVKLILEHLFLISNIHSDVFNNAIWSLVHEMRISIIFPLIYLIVIRCNWKMSITICCLLSFATGLNDYFLFQVSNGYYTTYFDTLHYASMFIIGILLVKHLNHLLELYRKFSSVTKWVLFILAFGFYNYSGIGSVVVSKLGLPMGRIVSDYIIVLGAVLFILISMGSAKIAKILMLKPIRFLGKISYSLYLYHLIALYSLIYLLYNITSIWVIYGLTIIISILLATASYYYVEKPFIILGRKLILKVQRDKGKSFIIQANNSIISAMKAIVYNFI